MTGKTARAPWGARPHAPGDLPQAVDLLTRSGNGESDWRHYRWRYLTTPPNTSVPTVWYADTGDRLVGQYATCIQSFQLGRESLHVLQGEAMLADPDYLDQPLITELATEALAAWRAARFPFLFQLQNTASPSRSAPGWDVLFGMSWLWRPLRPGAYLRQHDFPGSFSALAGVVGLLGNAALHAWMRVRGRRVRVSEIDRPDERFDHLWERLRVHYTALTVRDRAWLDYRFKQAPSSGYRILLAERWGEPTGYLVYHLTENEGLRTGWVDDLFTDPTDQRSRSALLRHATSRLYRAGAVTLRLLVARRTALERWFRQLGFLPGRESHFVTLLPLRDDMPVPALRDPNQFFLMAGDFDVL